MLDVDSAIPYLMAQGLLGGAAIIDGELTVTSMARRNRNLKVQGPAGNSYLIKQPDGPAGGGGRTLRHEASFYTFCHEHLDDTPVPSLLPRLAHFDSAIPLLALELLGDALPLWQHCRARTAADFPRETARALGRALGTVHATFRPLALAGDDRLRWLPRDPPWILRAHQPTLDWLSTISAAGYQALHIIQTRRSWVGRLDRLAGSWRPDTVIHGDVKSDNVLAMSPRPRAAPTSIEVRLVDWELVQYGDAAWDLAGALQDFVVFWVNTLPVEPGMTDADLDELLARATYPWAVIQAALRALWQGYRGAAGMDVACASALLLRAVQVSSARLIQTTMEMTQERSKLPSQAILLLQIAANLLEDPGAAQVQFYGIPQSVEA
ncbi:MAG TPA: phosphotransferase [Myxococcaceae bacterium]|nr:phosphotransferase [Myxococcaceae bacterium]